MKANFGHINDEWGVLTQEWLDKRAGYLSDANWTEPGTFREEPGRPPGFETYYCVGVLGKEFVWMNETFPKEKFKWYLRFESIFLVPKEMVPFLRLRWP